MKLNSVFLLFAGFILVFSCSKDAPLTFNKEARLDSRTSERCARQDVDHRFLATSRRTPLFTKNTLKGVLDELANCLFTEIEAPPFCGDELGGDSPMQIILIEQVELAGFCTSKINTGGCPDLEQDLKVGIPFTVAMQDEILNKAQQIAQERSTCEVGENGWSRLEYDFYVKQISCKCGLTNCPDAPGECLPKANFIIGVDIKITCCYG